MARKICVAAVLFALAAAGAGCCWGPRVGCGGCYAPIGAGYGYPVHGYGGYAAAPIAGPIAGPVFPTAGCSSCGL
jgi:hypothetical protein